ncbi:hypothetical protein BHM03_00016438 [Ensete ventricosum]|nr:hypothetical protein BHM03_00016438 [Ensete ventricosum]
MANESARLGSTHVRKLSLVEQEEVRSSEEIDRTRSEVQLRLVTSVKGFTSGRSKILAQRPCQGEVPDVDSPKLKLVPQPRIGDDIVSISSQLCLRGGFYTCLSEVDCTRFLNVPDVLC